MNGNNTQQILAQLYREAAENARKHLSPLLAEAREAPKALDDFAEALGLPRLSKEVAPEVDLVMYQAAVQPVVAVFVVSLVRSLVSKSKVKHVLNTEDLVQFWTTTPQELGDATNLTPVLAALVKECVARAMTRSVTLRAPARLTADGVVIELKADEGRLEVSRVT